VADLARSPLRSTYFSTAAHPFSARSPPFSAPLTCSVHNLLIITGLSQEDSSDILNSGYSLDSIYLFTFASPSKLLRNTHNIFEGRMGFQTGFRGRAA